MTVTARTSAQQELEVIIIERDELSADLARLRKATRVRPSKKAMTSLKDMLETMEAMDEEDAPALRVLIEMCDKLESI